MAAKMMKPNAQNKAMKGAAKAGAAPEPQPKDAKAPAMKGGSKKGKC